ncbi:hypothetical protein ACFVAV_13445 [Nocardia sp. NPDC057663]|uniref:hypothetical protein n=1 Tax=Nocardia sp. NPDC057663 TaxID=3346201 RepID=UPI00366FEAE5
MTDRSYVVIYVSARIRGCDPNRMLVECTTHLTAIQWRTPLTTSGWKSEIGLRMPFHAMGVLAGKHRGIPDAPLNSQLWIEGLGQSRAPHLC